MLRINFLLILSTILLVSACTSKSPPQVFEENSHEAFLELARNSNIELLFVGDSITDRWRNVGRPVWDKYFAPLKAANFGIDGDNTQRVLWRMQNGELVGYKSKLIVLMIGTNNINSNSSVEIADGIRLILLELKKHQPLSKVLLLGIFPRGLQASDPYRSSIHDINLKLAALADDKQIFFLDIGSAFLASDGRLTTEIMPDGLHLSLAGYQIWADTIINRVKELIF